MSGISEKKTESHLKFNRLFRNSKLRNKFYINQFVPNPSRVLESSTLLMLKDGDFIDKGINIVISGMTGTGKTALATATTVEAMQKGYSVVFYRFNDLMTIINSKDQQSFCRFRDRIKNIRLLIIDDYGLTRVPNNIVCALTEIANVRYGMGSTIITTQLRKKALKSVIDESPIRGALAVRLFRDCDIEITLKGTSWRGSNEELKGEKMITDTDVKTIISAPLKKISLCHRRDFCSWLTQICPLMNRWTLFAILSILSDPFPKERMLSFCAN